MATTTWLRAVAAELIRNKPLDPKQLAYALNQAADEIESLDNKVQELESRLGEIEHRLH